ncbi:MAG: hypothetical protein LUG51_05460 [Tannerellaceae bacterium]|nr:hypothetical protein [Tannerellaceae bacterium]
MKGILLNAGILIFCISLFSHCVGKHREEVKPIQVDFVQITLDKCKDISEETPVQTTLSTYEQTEENVNKLMDSFSKNEFRIEYPPYYGGMYLNDDYQLVILINGDPDIYKEELVKRIENDRFILRACDYSYIYLENVLQSIHEILLGSENKNLMNQLRIAKMGIDEKKIA